MTKQELGTEVLKEIGIYPPNIGMLVEYVESFSVNQLQARTIVAKALEYANLNDLYYYNVMLAKVNGFIMDMLLDKFEINLYDDYCLEVDGSIRSINEKDEDFVELQKILKKYVALI